MAKARLFLSVEASKAYMVSLAALVARLLATLRIVANVVPMFSSVHNCKTGTFDLETAARIDVLSAIEQDQILVLWEKLRARTKEYGIPIHCVWLDVREPGTPDNEDWSYSGCICNWPHYIRNYDKIGHAEPLKCSEYDDGPVLDDVEKSQAYGQ